MIFVASRDQKGKKNPSSSIHSLLFLCCSCGEMINDRRRDGVVVLICFGREGLACLVLWKCSRDVPGRYLYDALY